MKGVKVGDKLFIRFRRFVFDPFKEDGAEEEGGEGRGVLMQGRKGVDAL